MRRPSYPKPSPPSVVSLCFLVLCLLPSAEIPAQEAADGASLGVRVGTAGYGPELAFPLSERVGLRLAAGFGSVDVDFDSEAVTYEGEVEMQNVLAVVDLFPAGGAFRISAGALLNDNRLEGDAPIRDVLLDAGVEIPEQIAPLPLGSLHAEAGVAEVAPYLGLGFGRRDGRGTGFHLAFDLGVAYHGEPDVSLQVREVPIPLAAIPGADDLLAAILAAEERELEAELKEYRFFPVVALSLAYRF